MAKAFGIGSIYKSNKRKRPGVHAKTKNSRSKGSKNYVKPYNGQGRK
jgi:hypothetical protein